MKHPLYFLLSLPLFFFAAINVIAQPENAANKDSCLYHVEGYVLDLRTQEPLPYASVQVKESKTGTFTDQNGHFMINKLCQKEFDLIVTYVGYKKVIHHHDTYHEVPKILMAADSVTLESVIVEGDIQEGALFSGTVSQLSSNTFRQNQSESLGDLASNISGVSTLKTGQNIVKPIIHGLHSNRVLIVNNGVRHEFQNWGVEHAPEIDPSMANQISVVKGAATVRYGPDALGGVLIINPNKLELLTPFSGEVNLVGKSNGRSADGHIRLQKGFHKFSVQAQASNTYQGDVHAPDYVLSNTGKRETSMSLGTRYHWKTLDLYASYSHFNQNLGILRGSVTGNLEDLALAIKSSPPLYTADFNYQIDNPRQQVQHDVFKLKGVISGDNQSLELIYAFQKNQRLEFDVRRGANNESPAINLELMSQTLDLEWKHPDLFAWEGSLGIQTIYQDNNNLPGTNTIPFIPNYNFSRIGFYLIESKNLDEMRLEWGLRYDFQYNSIRGRATDNEIYRNELSFQNMTATLGLIKPLQNDHLFRSNIGTAWRPPNVSELYSFGKHQASIEYGLWRYQMDESNDVINDQILDQDDKAAPAEMGIKWINTYEINHELVRAEFTGYVNYIRNYIYTKPAGITQTVRGAFPFFIYDQDDALFAGLDASIEYYHTSNIHSQAMLSYVWAKDIANDEQFVGIPPLNIQYSYHQSLRKFAFIDQHSWNASLSYTFQQFQAPPVVSIEEILEAQENDANIFDENASNFDLLPPPECYLMFNLGWNAQVNRFNIGFRVKNVLNTSYRTYTDRLRYFADDLGRNYVLQLRYQF
ncbi:iron complex outermembrane receptor protein [Catalinimonas alkaloidigena]|uniref:TonB-dependent receptor n=1 Tax=Catalinimonas alkaloidigena TaxID=1075417 RepID=UPI00240668C4|nr:TonB-dependent receptor [Catalinimonas alkaloidigena]MDF9797112.1 iron complex outermembrane receptor protein [Catalinimonas alkaloidigena]